MRPSMPATAGRRCKKSFRTNPSPILVRIATKARMSRNTPQIVGTIRIEPESIGFACDAAEDSTLDLVLARLARRGRLIDGRLEDREPARLLIARRQSLPRSASAARTVPANLERLLDDLQSEFERVAG